MMTEGCSPPRGYVGTVAVWSLRLQAAQISQTVSGYWDERTVALVCTENRICWRLSRSLRRYRLRQYERNTSSFGKCDTFLITSANEYHSGGALFRIALPRAKRLPLSFRRQVEPRWWESISNERTSCLDPTPDKQTDRPAFLESFLELL
jgi:hypothetical protein